MAFSPDWDACARLQKQLSKSYSVDARSAGIEAALNRFLDDAMKSHTSTDEELARAASGARRAMRRRSALIAKSYPENSNTDPRPALESADMLSRAQAVVSLDQWRLALSIAQGDSYAELAANTGHTPQSLRIALHRLRARWSKMAA